MRNFLKYVYAFLFYSFDDFHRVSNVRRVRKGFLSSVKCGYIVMPKHFVKMYDQILLECIEQVMYSAEMNIKAFHCAGSLKNTLKRESELVYWDVNSQLSKIFNAVSGSLVVRKNDLQELTDDFVMRLNRTEEIYKELEESL